MKLALIDKVAEIGETVGPAVGEYVIVPDHFPYLITVKVARRGNFALLGEEEFRVWPEATPVEAWAEFHSS